MVVTTKCCWLHCSSGLEKTSMDTSGRGRNYMNRYRSDWGDNVVDGGRKTNKSVKNKNNFGYRSIFMIFLVFPHLFLYLFS